jgi:protein-tyrosine phosphatase
MGYPSTGLDKYYRNAASTVFRFFETNHQHHYRIYNLCINRRYPDKSDLRPHVARYGFFDHNPCPMQTLRSLCLDVDLWLTEHPANIAAIHCKAGKGRTGLVVAAYLMHSGAVHNAEDAIRFFGNKRTKDGRGVTIPSQYRYVRYYELALNDEKLMHRIEGPVSAGVVFHLVAITFHSVDVTWPAPHAQAIKLRVLAPDGVLMAKTKAYEYYPRSPTMPAEGPPKFAHGFELDTLGLSSTGEVLDTQADTVVDAAPVTTQRKGHVRQQPSQGSSSVKARIFGGSATLPGSALEALNVPAPPPCGFAMVRPITPVRVQGDTRLHVQFATKRLTGSGNSSTTMFQCWFNTNFLPVSNKSSGGGESDFVFAGAMSPTELGDSRARSCMPLMKIELDGKIRKDKAHKITPANFVMAMHFVAAKSQPNVELSPSGRRLDF